MANQSENYQIWLKNSKKQKWKTAIWQEQQDLCSGVVRIQMTFLQDIEISIGFPNAW